ncbi:MAG: tRNA pseudouridine(55) synthase TruB [Lachnospiraceae bacterium]|nr:tRNA pseudouridine(55) synthase TruB [Lachnospiraceae bacterium]
MADINGVINVYKEAGYTSHDVVAKLRGILKIKKIGHTGTLDPEAEGVLPICIGNATKLCDLITDKQKEYQGVLKLGVRTDTQDMTGKIIQSYDGDINFSQKEIEEVVQGFVGNISQIPPMYSALKVNGKKLYDLARQGIEVERKPRNITIHYINIDEVNMPYVTMTIGCSKGTYIRTLFNDIGDKLKTYGAMEKLLRTKSGNFVLDNTIKLSEIECLVKEDALMNCDSFITTDEVLSDFQKIHLKDEYKRFVMNGNMIDAKMIDEDILVAGSYRVYIDSDRFVALYKTEDAKTFVPEKMFLP